MHGTEPAGFPAPDPTATDRAGPPAVVLTLARQGRRLTPPPVDPDIIDVAAYWQTMYTGAGLSLADPATAAAHRATIKGLRILVDAARHTGSLDEAAAGYVTQLLAEAEATPDLV